MIDDSKSRFSETAEKILRDSERIASTMATGIGSEHLLVALSSNPGTVAYEALRELMVTPERIAFILPGLIGKLKTESGVSNEIKQILKIAYQKAASFGSFSVDSEHLLLALVANKNCNGHTVLGELGVDPKLLKDQLEGYLEQIANADQTVMNRFNESSDLGNDTLISPFPSEPSARAPSRAKNALDYFTTDLTKQAKAGKLDPVIGRETEIRRISQILVRRLKNNPVLTGEPGVGKTAIVEGLAARIAAGEVPRQLADKRLLSLDLALLIAGTTYRGQFEERTKKLLDEISKSGNVILFLDEIHTIVGAGAAEGSMDLGHILKPALAKGQLRLIGATTNEEYRKYIEKDPALERRFQRVNVEEPSIEETIEILRGLKPIYESHHSLTINDEAVVTAAQLAKRYINDRFLPDKAIDLIDEAAAATHLEPQELKLHNRVGELETKRRQANLEHQRAAEEFNYRKSAAWRVQELRLINEIDKLKITMPKDKPTRVIEQEDIARVVAQWTGIPVTTLSKTEKIRLSNLEKVLKNHIVGQEEAVTAVARAIRRGAAGVHDPNRPYGSFIFLGPTGVGKTELAKVLAREVYGRESALVKIDMSEFMERHNLSRLVGAPPGYVGYEDAGKLTEAIRRQPYSVILLDEIEKAHPDVFNLLLQIMEDGYLTDAKGRRVSFKNTTVIMTSNLGVGELNRAQSIGFHTDSNHPGQSYAEIRDRVLKQLKESFRPEFLNRLDETIVFQPLNSEAVYRIVELQLDRLAMRLLPEGVTLQFEESAKQFLAEKGFEPSFGARPVRRAILSYVETPLSELLLSGKIDKSLPIRVLKKGEKLVLIK